jgi:hypothetical protein
MLISGNICGLLANLNSIIEGPALNLLFSKLDELDPVALHILITGLAYRVLRSAGADPTRMEIRSRLVPVLIDFTRRSGKGVNCVTASACWCYLKAFAKRFPGSVASQESWPALDDTYEKKEAAKSLAWTRTVDGSLPPEHRSLQIAFLMVQDEVLTIRERAISVMHYLYIISAIFSDNGQCEEVSMRLPQILEAGSSHFAAIQEYDEVSELVALFQTCRKLCRIE